MKVLLCSVETWDSMGEIPSIFRRAGYERIDLLCPPGAWLCAGCHHDHWLPLPEEEAAAVTTIIALAQQNEPYYDRIYLLDDRITMLVNAAVEDPDLFYRLLPLTKIENRELLSSKAGLSRLCEKYGITTPEFRVWQAGMTAGELFSGLQFPVLLKQDFSWGGGGINYCATTAEAEQAFNPIADPTNLVCQEFIRGEDIGVEAYFHQGHLVTYNASKVLAYAGNRFSWTTRRVYLRIPALERLLMQLGEALGLNGFASISYIYHPWRNLYYLIEVDMRTNNWMPYSRFTGFDFADGLRQIAAGTFQPRSWRDDPAPEQTPPVELALFYRDFRRCVKGGDVYGLLRWVFNYKGYWRFLPIYDLKIFRKICRELRRDLWKKIKPNPQFGLSQAKLSFFTPKGKLPNPSNG